MLSYDELADAIDRWADDDGSEKFNRKLADCIPQGSFERIMFRMTDSPQIAGATDPLVALGIFKAGFELGFEIARTVFEDER